MESAENKAQAYPTPETVSPTANWAKPEFKSGLKLRPKLKLRSEFGERSTIPPTIQPVLNRIGPSKDELLDSYRQVVEFAETSRRALARTLNQLED